MSISGISSNASTNAIIAAQQAARKQLDIWNPSSSASTTPTQDSFTSDFASILASVQSGDITSAQAALTKLQSDQAPGELSYSPQSTAASTNAASTPQGDVQSLLQAVQGGDITAAQKALTSLQSDIQADASSATSGATPTNASPTQPAVHHHGHHHHAKPAAAPTDSTTDSTIDPATGLPTADSVFSSTPDSAI
ncbi:MAG TPA: hypothetical protein VGM67_19925 [Gemmatimonadaceae bacterium]|jgi:hypothetical protein